MQRDFDRLARLKIYTRGLNLNGLAGAISNLTRTVGSPELKRDVRGLPKEIVSCEGGVLSARRAPVSAREQEERDASSSNEFTVERM